MPPYMMLIDSEKCIDCKACVVACQQRNHVPYGHSRNWVKASPHEDSPTGFKYQPGACMHCQDAPCLPVCPSGATFRNQDGVVLINADTCIGCGACIEACPYEARFRHPQSGIADKCDYCLASGQPPACVEACPLQCRFFGDAGRPDSPLRQILATRKAVHTRPEGMDIRPTLAYLDATTPETFPAPQKAYGPLSAMAPAARALTWIGGIAMALLTGTFIRQLIKPTEGAGPDNKEDKQS